MGSQNPFRGFWWKILEAYNSMRELHSCLRAGQAASGLAVPVSSSDDGGGPPGGNGWGGASTPSPASPAALVASYRSSSEQIVLKCGPKPTHRLSLKNGNVWTGFHFLNSLAYAGRRFPTRKEKICKLIPKVRHSPCLWQQLHLSPTPLKEEIPQEGACSLLGLC